MYWRSVPFWAGIWSIGIGTSGNSTGIDQRDDSERRVFGAEQRDPRLDRQGGEGQAAEILHVHDLVRSSPVTVTVPGEPSLPA